MIFFSLSSNEQPCKRLHCFSSLRSERQSSQTQKHCCLCLNGDLERRKKKAKRSRNKRASVIKREEKEKGSDQPLQHDLYNALYYLLCRLLWCTKLKSIFHPHLSLRTLLSVFLQTWGLSNIFRCIVSSGMWIWSRSRSCILISDYVFWQFCYFFPKRRSAFVEQTIPSVNNWKQKIKKHNSVSEFNRVDCNFLVYIIVLTHSCWFYIYHS